MPETLGTRQGAWEPVLAAVQAGSGIHTPRPSGDRESIAVGRPGAEGGRGEGGGGEHREPETRPGEGWGGGAGPTATLASRVHAQTAAQPPLESRRGSRM